MTNTKDFVLAIIKERSKGEREFLIWNTIIDNLNENQLLQLEGFLKADLDFASRSNDCTLHEYVQEERELADRLKDALTQWSEENDAIGPLAEALNEVNDPLTSQQIARMFASDDTAASFLASLSVVQLQDMIEALQNQEDASVEADRERDYLIELLHRMQEETFHDHQHMKALLSPFGEDIGTVAFLQSQIESLDEISAQLSV